MSTRLSRVARGFLAAVVSTLVAAGSHTLAGGTAPGTVALVLGLATAAIVCIALTGKRLSLPRLAAAVSLSQYGFHSLFSSMGDFAAAPTHAQGHLHGVAALGADTVVHHTSALMWVGHAIAAVLTIAALGYGELAYRSLRTIAGRVIHSLAPTAPLPVDTKPGARSAPASRPFAPTFFDIHSTSLRYRGPPVVRFA
jgi:hypothetical protein